MDGKQRYPLVRLRPRRPERQGHPWVFAGEIDEISPLAENGDVVRVVDAGGRVQGMALLNRRSKITCRYLTDREQEIDADWWFERLAAAMDRRRTVYATDATDALRLVNAEADGLPGLIVDRYAGVAVTQFLVLGLEPWRELLIGMLMELVRPHTLWERSDVAVRELEGLEQRRGLLAGREPPALVEVREGVARLLVDVREGQKTGMFLDQRRNRAAAAAYAAGARALNCFAYSGAFGVHAGLQGAAEVINADISAAACALAEENVRHNGLQERSRTIEANCFDLLRAWSDGPDRLDMVILDPPAFTKNRAAVEGALRGYKEINLRAMRLLRPGGILVTCSCSQHIDELTFKEMLLAAARDARRTVRLLEQRGQGPDHPVLLGMPETQYLICIIAEVARAD